MCHTLPYRSPHCPHRWLVLSTPCRPNLSFRTAPPGHAFTRPRTFLGSTHWYPAPPGSCPDCDLKGVYNGDRVRLYLGKGRKAERAARDGLFGPYGNGFWGGEGDFGRGGGYGNMYGNQYGAGVGYGAGYGGGYEYGGAYVSGQGYVPGEVAMRSFGGYGYKGGYKGNPFRRYPGQKGRLLGCFGL